MQISKSYADVLKVINNNTSTQTDSSQKDSVMETSASEQNKEPRNESSSQPPVTQEQVSTSKPNEPPSRNSHEATTKSENIPTHWPSSRCHPVDLNQFRGYISKQKRNVCRYYIGGIDKRTSSENILRNYLASKGIHVTFLRYFEKRSRQTASAQVNIDADGAELINDPYFWPEGIYMKDWLPWSVFRSQLEY